MKCTYNANKSTYILYGLLVKIRYIFGPVEVWKCVPRQMGCFSCGRYTQSMRNGNCDEAGPGPANSTCVFTSFTSVKTGGKLVLC